MSKSNKCFVPGCYVGNQKHRKEHNIASTPNVKYPSLFTTPKYEVISNFKYVFIFVK